VIWRVGRLWGDVRVALSQPQPTSHRSAEITVFHNSSLKSTSEDNPDVDSAHFLLSHSLKIYRRSEWSAFTPSPHATLREVSDLLPLPALLRNSVALENLLLAASFLASLLRLCGYLSATTLLVIPWQLHKYVVVWCQPPPGREEFSAGIDSLNHFT